MSVGYTTTTEWEEEGVGLRVEFNTSDLSTRTRTALF